MLGILATKDLDVLTSSKVTKIDKGILDSLGEQGFVIDPKPIEDKLITHRCSGFLSCFSVCPNNV